MGRERTFCSKCGTHLFVNAPGYFGVSAGALEDEEQCKMTLQSELFIDLKPDYYEFSGERTRMTEAEFMAMVSGGSGGEDDTAKGEEEK